MEIIPEVTKRPTEMKRILTISAIVLLSASVLTAQSRNDRKYTQYTPEAGEFGLTISANPITGFLGNLFNGTQGNNIGEVGGQPYNPGLDNPLPTVSIAGRYFLTNELAIRLNVGWMYSNDKNNYYAQDDAALAADPFSRDKVIDSHTTNNSGGSFMVGAEYRLGRGRVQGIFGGGLMYAFNYYREKFSYGNAITEINQFPSTGITGQNNPDIPGFNTPRYLSKFNGTPTHYAGIVGFVGVEWFFAPKVSLGAEVNIAAAYNWTNGTYYTAEGYNTISGQVEEWTELLTPSSSGFDFGTKNIGANLSVNFYF